MDRNITEALKIPESVRVPLFGGLWYKWLCKLDNQTIRREQLPENPLNTEAREEKVIVSLTSYPARIAYVHLAIKSLMLQSYKPDRIVLWLAEEQFPDKVLPKELVDLQRYGLEIRYGGNLFGHKKYFYALQEQKNDELVVTYDDDIIYPPNSLKKLIETHQKYPKCIICNRAQALAFDSNGKVKNVGKWDTISEIGVKRASFQLCPSTGGGCLYPSNALHTDFKNEKKIKDLALRADDPWIMFMAVSCGTPIIKTVKYHHSFTTIEQSQVEQLAQGNMVNNAYEVVLEKLIDAYPAAWERIRKGE